MKKFLLVLLASATALSFSGCQKKEDVSPETEEAELDAVSSSLSGTLIKYTGSEITIETSDGEKLSFDNCEKAQLDLENGIIPGNKVTLMYVGAIEDTDTSKVKIRKITTTDDNSSVLALAKKAEESIPNSTGSPVILEENDTDEEDEDEKSENKKEKTDETDSQKENDKKKDNKEDTTKKEEDKKEEYDANELAVGDSKETTIASSVYVRSEPKSGSEILGTLQDGAAVTITNIDGSGWYEVSFEGQTGYIWKDYVN